MGDAIAYAMLNTFVLFFLTTVAEISPFWAGTIVIIGTLWNAVFTPFLGYFADRFHENHKRRGPMILIFGIPLGLALFLMFTYIAFPPIVKEMYYCLVLILYWTCYTGFFIPYCALGVDYTADYSDRTKLRLFASLFNSVGAIFTFIMPNTIVSLLETHGVSTASAWAFAGAVLGLMATGSILCTIMFSKDHDVPPAIDTDDNHSSFSFLTIILSYMELIKEKPLRYLTATSFAALITISLVNSSAMYFLTFKLGLTPNQITICLLLRTLIGVCYIPLVAKLCETGDKRHIQILFWALMIVCMLIVRFAALPVILIILIYLIGSSLSSSTYWQIIPSVFYDVCEYDKIVNRRNMSAAILSYQSFIETLAAGIGSQLLGYILQFAGFDGGSAEQSATTLMWLNNSATIIPCLFIVIAILFLYRYPITRKMYNELLQPH